MTGKGQKTSPRRLGEVIGEAWVPIVLTNFAEDADEQLTRLVRAYFTGRRSKLSLLPGAKVVARLEVRCSGHYLDVSLAEVGEDGKVHWRAARHHPVRTRRRG